MWKGFFFPRWTNGLIKVIWIPRTKRSHKTTDKTTECEDRALVWAVSDHSSSGQYSEK